MQGTNAGVSASWAMAATDFAAQLDLRAYNTHARGMRSERVVGSIRKET